MRETMRRFRDRCYFKRIKHHIDVAPLIEEMERNKDAWNYDMRRQQTYAVHKDTRYIPLIEAVLSNGVYEGDVHECHATPLAGRFPRTLAFAKQYAEFMNGTLGRVQLVTLSPGSRVGIHFDGGAYYRVRDRFHLVLKAEGKSGLRVEDREAILRKGELWWFANKKWHSAFNDGEYERIHLIFDVKRNTT